MKIIPGNEYLTRKNKIKRNLLKQLKRAFIRIFNGDKRNYKS